MKSDIIKSHISLDLPTHKKVVVQSNCKTRVASIDESLNSGHEKSRLLFRSSCETCTKQKARRIYSQASQRISSKASQRIYSQAFRRTSSQASQASQDCQRLSSQASLEFILSLLEFRRLFSGLLLNHQSRFLLRLLSGF